MLLIELLIDIFFLSDIALNFNTGYISEQARDFAASTPLSDMCAVDSATLLISVLEAFGLGSMKTADRCRAWALRTRAEVAQVLVMERRAVAGHYLHTWFVLDLVASIPLDLLLRGRRLDILRLPRLLKIIRMMQNKSFSQAGENHGPKTAEGSPSDFPGGLHALENSCTLARPQRQREAPEGVERQAFSDVTPSRRRQMCLVDMLQG